MNMFRLVTLAFIAALALALPDAEAATRPSEVIEDAVDLLNEGLDGRKEELAADEAALRAFIDGILLPRFDREFAAGAVLGKHWRTASDEQKDRFVSAFYATLVAALRRRDTRIRHGSCGDSPVQGRCQQTNHGRQDKCTSR